MTQQPNIVFIIADQLRADFLGCYGATFVETPNIDSLAQDGVYYTRAYSASPICVPARASLLTGMNAIKNGVTSNGQWLRPDLHTYGIHTWPEQLAARGYYTAAIGKMHFYPWDASHGFRYRVAAEDKRWIHVRDDYYHFLRQDGYRKYHGNEHDGYFENRGAILNRLPWTHSVDHFVGQEAAKFIRTYGEETPFAAMISFPGPHCPYDPNQEFLAEIDPAAMPTPIPAVEADSGRLRQQNIHGNRQAWNGVDYTEFTDAHKQKIRAHYAASVAQIDYEVGQILDALRERGLLESTIILFTSDHGDYLGDHDLIGKGSFYEGSIHVPLIVRLPDGGDASTWTDLVELGDITATILAAAGCDLPDYMDSIPLPALGLPQRSPRTQVVGMTSGGWMLYDGVWKLVKYATGDIHLFNLAEDPTEQRNRIHDPACRDRYLEMDTRLTQEIMRSIVAANHEKSVDTGNGLWSDVEYGKRGWRRTYPFPIKE
jgi:arylsulfatase A-like enzyme